MRDIVAHYDGAINNKLKVAACVDGPGGAPDYYSITWEEHACNIQFAKAGEVGVTNEALLAILADRLIGFQTGPFKCDENGEALHHIHKAMELLKSRTRRRMALGIEGKPVEKQDPEGTTHPARIFTSEDKVFLRIGEVTHKIEFSRLATEWRAWSVVESVVRRFQPPITENEIALLRSLATQPPGKNGFAELMQVLKHNAAA